MDVSVKLTREGAMVKVSHRAEDAAEDRVLDALLPRPAHSVGFTAEGDDAHDNSDTRQKFRKMLREGKLDDKEIEIDIQAIPMGVEIMAPPGMEEMTSQLQGMFQNLSGGRQKTKKLKVTAALKLLTDDGEQKRWARMFPARACNGICCHWWKAHRSTPSTVWSRPITFFSSPRVLFTSVSHLT
jgi:ATP-dependent HslUV protease ATP-binding subunit HslU